MALRSAGETNSALRPERAEPVEGDVVVADELGPCEGAGVLEGAVWAGGVCGDVAEEVPVVAGEVRADLVVSVGGACPAS